MGKLGIEIVNGVLGHCILVVAWSVGVCTVVNSLVSINKLDRLLCSFGDLGRGGGRGGGQKGSTKGIEKEKWQACWAFLGE